ncbi:MAG: PAS domain S-box protein [Steroidobacteraceae bacterium]
MDPRRPTEAIERPRAAAGSKQGELEFRALMNAAVDAVIVIDHRGLVEEFSLAAERMFGYRAEEVIGRNISMLMPEPDRSAHDGHLARYGETRQARIIGIGREIVAMRRDGGTFPCELAVGRVPESEPPRFVGFVRDLTRPKEAEELLRRSEEELRLAQGLANLGNYVTHPAGDGPDYYSPQLMRILDLEPGEARIEQHEYFAKWVHPSDRARVVEAFRHLDSGGPPLDIEYQIVLRDGRTRHLHHIAQAVRDGDGQTVKLVGTIHDITDRRHAEDEARQLQDRLTHFSRLSTMGEMAAGLAHEINQPLSAIATYAQASQRLLRQPEPDIAEVVGALEHINAQALRAGEVIRRLRTFVKNREVRREWVDCTRLLDDLRTLAETDARLHNVVLQIEADEDLPPVHADPIQVQQVVLNLVRNAIDAMQDGRDDSREVVLRTRRTADGEVCITVADHGCGISAEAAEHLFNPFFTTKATGTGLGLAISRSIIRAHGGRLWHTPNERSGTQFHFTLPAAPATKGDEQ